jgi:hypothetical protein
MNKLREYKGVTYRDDVWWYEGVGYDSAIHLLHLADWGSDADHAALMALKAEPYESKPFLESLLHNMIREIDSRKGDEATAFYVRDFAATFRYAFPQIDTPLTAADHIAALVAMGAMLWDDVVMVEQKVATSGHRFITPLHSGTRTLILPPEMTP